MPRFFSETQPQNEFRIENEDAKHIIYSLRMKIGDEITVCYNQTDFICEIFSMGKNNVDCRVKSFLPTVSEPNIKLTIFQAYPKQDKLELIIQKTTELGVFSIVPFTSNRCVAKPDKKDFSKKLERFNRIASEAAKQSGRGIIPKIEAPMTFSEACKSISNYDLVIICYEKGGKKLSEIDFSGYKNIAVIIGSEGGFEQSEVEQFIQNSAVPIWLGNRILRCETCPIAITAIIMNLTDNL